MRVFILMFTVSMAIACSGATGNDHTPTVNSNSSKQGPVPVYGYEIVNTYPHDPKAFTEGLFYTGGYLYESTGGEKAGESTVRRVELTTGKVVQKWDLPGGQFGEGIAMIGDKIYMLTWQDQLGRVFDAKTFELLKEFSYQGQGWGMTTDGTNLIFDQGTHVLKFVDPTTFKTIKTVPVMREDGRPLMQLNELEIINGELWANVWHSEKPDILGKANYIARIDPNSGKLLGWIDLQGISPDDQLKPGEKDDPSNPNSKGENTLNGIAYDAATGRIFVTGKNWKKLYEIRVTGPKNQ